MISKFNFILVAVLSAFLPNLINHYRIFKKLGVGSQKDLLKAISLTTLTVLFEAGGLAMVLPIIGFLKHDQDPIKFADQSKVGQYIVDIFSTVHLPLHLLSLSLLVIIMITMRQLLNYGYTLHISQIKLRVGKDLSIKIFSAILGSRSENISEYKSGYFANLLTQECQATSSVIRNYATIWSLLLTFAAYFTLMLVLSPIASIAAFLLMFSMVFILGFLMNITRTLAARRIHVRSAYLSFLNERFRAWRLIKLADSLPYECEKATQFAQAEADTEYRVSKVAGVIQLFMAPIVMTVALLSTYVAIEYFHIDVEEVTMFIVILLRLVPTGQSLNSQRNQLASFDPSMKLVQRSLEQASHMGEVRNQGLDTPPLQSGIRFENVSFSYDTSSSQVIKNICFEIPAGKMTAIIGPSGAGKTTVIDLINRLYLPVSGQILYDGTPINELSLVTYRAQFSTVTQDTFLFDGSILDSIKYFHQSASMEEVEEAARLSHVSDFIQKLPNGYDTQIGENGVSLSGGEKQRIALARAFLSKAKIIILDEPTSSLDVDSEAKIRDALERLVNEGQRTIIVIAHRLSTIENAALVLRMSNGVVVDSGSPKKVLNNENDADLAANEIL